MYILYRHKSHLLKIFFRISQKINNKKTLTKKTKQ